MTERDSDQWALAAEFPPASRAQWLALVEGVLKGAPFDKRLVTRTYDGLAIAPLHDRDASARPVAARNPGAPWRIIQRADHPDPAAANAQALHDLENGATGLSLVFAGSIGAYGFGIPASASAITRALESIHLDAGIALDLDLAADSSGAPAAIVDLAARRGIDPAKLDWQLSFDPVGALAASGASLVDWPILAPRFAATIGEFAGRGFRGPFALADGRVIHNAGGSEVQELAFALAAALAYLRAFESTGASLETARKWVGFKLAADADQFLTIAKFRALRKLWARAEEACGLVPMPAYVAAETAWRMMTRRDPWVNMLRATVAAFSAGIGGANAVTVLPFTLALGLPDGFARRLARNTQLLLLEESNLARVADPAAGSGGIEDLTDKLCDAAWTQFQAIERTGGVWAALQGGSIQRDVARVRAERATAVGRRKDALTGTSEFPDIHEAVVTVLIPSPLARSATGTPHPDPFPASGERKRAGGGNRAGVFSEPLPSLRLAEPFEALRDASDQALAKNGERPRVFLANLGTLAEFTPRTTFAKNLFEAGGIEAVTNEGFARSLSSDRHPLRDASRPPQDVGSAAHARHPEERAVRASKGDARLSTLPSPTPRADPPLSGEDHAATDLAALTAAFKASGARLACLCSSDEVYAREAVAAATALKAAGAGPIYLAGRPGEAEATLREAGVQGFVYVGCDVLATLQAAHDILR